MDLAHGRAYQIVCWTLFGFWFAALNLLSSMSPPDIPRGMEFEHADKVAHFGIFAVGAFLLATAWSASRKGVPTGRFVFVFLLMTLFGVADELRQLAIPGRTGADVGDMLANSAGALAGSFFSWILHAHFIPPKRRRR